MLKSTIRKRAIAERTALRAEDVSELSEKLLERLKTLDFSRIRSVHVFLPIVEKKEPNTFIILKWLQTFHPHIQLVVPKANFQNHSLSHYEFTGLHNLVKNKYQIPEPENTNLFTGIPDMVLIPLLAFDSRGYRVGYGKGFYDRFLQNVSTLKVGLSFFDEVQDIEDVDEYDVKLDLCITPNKIINFTS